MFRSNRAGHRDDSHQLEQQRLLREMGDAVGQARFDAAFATAERLLDHQPTTEAYEVLLRPFDRRDRTVDAPALYELLDRVERYRGTGHPAWRALFRFGLLDRLEWQEEAFAASAEFTALPERYAWMRYNRGTMLKDRLRDFSAARPELEAALRAAPHFWKAAGTLAECVLCEGHEAEAFAVLDRCIDDLTATGRPFDVATARVWRGEICLWLGRYGDAVQDLRDAAATGMPYGLIWHAAATLLLGEPQSAMAMLDKALTVDVHDHEAHIWRGEAHEALGQWDLAIADYDRAARLTGMPIWPLAGRALARAGKGDGAGTLADFAALPTRIAAFFQWKSDIRVEQDAQRAADVLRFMRAAARGVRRPERYLEAIWMQRSAAPPAPSPP